MTRSDPRVIARYDAFTLVEAAGDDAGRLRRAGADLRDDMRELRVGRAEIDPARDRVPLRALARRKPVLAVVQFVGPIKDAWLERLRKTGVRVVTYMAENGYLVRASGAELAALDEAAASDPAVRALVEFTPADKLLGGTGQEGRRRFAVQTLSGADGSPARTRAAARGRQFRETSAVGPFRTQYLQLDSAEAAALAEDPGVVSVQAAPAPELYDEVQDQILAGAVSGTDPLLPASPGYLAFHDGLGLGPGPFPFTVDVTDSGFDAGSTATSQPDFHHNGVIGANPAASTRVTYADTYTAENARDCGGHGTINASIVAGFNNGTGTSVEDAGSYNYGLGVAPRARVGSSKIFLCNGVFGLNTTLTQAAASSYGKGARIANHSWGAKVGGAYTADSQELDRIVRDVDTVAPGNQEMVEVVAAGNAGPSPNTVGSPGTAKNVITVGASENVRQSGTDGCGVTNTGADDAHDMIGFSSRGPTDDGRIKPEVVGPGTHVTGAQSQAADYNGNGVCTAEFPAASTLYNLSSGTSHSTPAVAGMSALFRQWFMLNRGGIAPSPALTRAALSNSATDIGSGVGSGGGLPNSSQGWGLANIPRLLDTGPRFFWDQQTTFGATGDSFQRTFAVADSSKPVRVTLAWTDAPGTPFTASQVNNLDLSVTAGASTYRGNVFTGGVSTTGGVADAVNNLEGVYLPNGTSGSITVTLTAANIAGNGVPGNADPTDQDFALIVSNVTAPPPAQPSGLTATPGSRSISLDWSDVANATGYEVFRRLASGSYPSSATASPSASAFDDTGLTPGAEYCYVVRALSGAVPGPLSSEACATVPGVAAPTVTGTDPASPANDNTPQVKGTAAPDSTVRLYPTSDCSGPAVASGTASAFGLVGIEASVPDGSSTTFRATAEGADGHESACSASSVTYIEDSRPPAAPAVNATDPPSPANDNTPRVRGSAAGASTVKLYASSDCSGPSEGSGTSADFASSGIEVAVGDNSSTIFRATALDAVGNESACSASFAPYVEDSTTPAPPSLTATSPASPANESSPRVIGTAEAGSTVRLYANLFCGGSSAATGSAADLASPGLQVVVSDDSTTTFYGTATDAAGNVSGCSLASITYTERSTPPGDPDPAPTVDLASLSSSVRVGARGTFSLAFAGTPGQVGTIKLTTVKAVSAARRRRLVVARKSFTVPASGRVRLRLKLTRTGFRVLRRVRRLPVSVRVTLGQTSAGKRVTLRAPRPRPRR